MTSEKKNEYTLRISQANKTGLIVILYEIAIDYVDEAIAAASAGDNGAMSLAAYRAMHCVEEMQNNLHFEYELAKSLNKLYLYMKKQLRNASISGDASGLNEVKKELTGLHKAYLEIADTDKSAPVMIHTQKVLAGMTYSKDRVLDDLTNEAAGRGFRV